MIRRRGWRRQPGALAQHGGVARGTAARVATRWVDACTRACRSSRPTRDTRTTCMSSSASTICAMTATSASPPAPENETEPRTEAAPAVRTEEEESELGAKEEERRKKDAAAAALTLEIVGDLPHADVKPPEKVLFVCKLNPVTRSEDLELIFSRFGKICSCEVIKDKKVCGYSTYRRRAIVCSTPSSSLRSEPPLNRYVGCISH